MRRDKLIIFIVALIARVSVALFQAHPGYMDAYYYTVGAQRLVEGYGFTEPYVWNYLDDPMTLPHVSHLYWMPLPSIVAAGSMAIFGVNYRAAQIPFVVLSAIVPVIAYAIAWRITSKRGHAWLAALLAVFSGFYLPFWGVPESFAPYAVFGSLALWWGSAIDSRKALVAAGACAALAHLTRADGILLLLPMILISDFGLSLADRSVGQSSIENRKSSIQNVFRRTLLIMLGYLLVMSPWFLRNLSMIDSPIASAGTQTLWLCNYDELFSFGVKLDVSHWLGCGVDQMMLAKLNALGGGLVHLIAEDGLIFLAPLMALGVWRLRRERSMRIALIYLLLLYLSMTLAFTYVGDRGGLFHSSAALLPFLYTAVPIGLQALVDAIARRRRTWDARSALRVFSTGLVLLAVTFSIAIVVARVVGSDWNRADADYRAVGKWLEEYGDANSIVMAGNPPGFTYHTAHPSIVIPDGDVQTLLAVADRFNAEWVALDANRPAALAALYDAPTFDPRFKLAGTFGKTYLLQITR